MEAGGRCGAGGTLKCIEAPDYRWYINCGARSNMIAELMSVWAVLTIAKFLEIKNL